MRLPTDSKERKQIPIFSGLIKYFPLALAKVASVSQEGNNQHNAGQPLHWDRTKSKDQMDALCRHVVDVAIEDGLGNEAADETLFALAQVAWRALAELQLRLEEKADFDSDVRAHTCAKCASVVVSTISLYTTDGVNTLCKDCYEEIKASWDDCCRGEKHVTK